MHGPNILISLVFLNRDAFDIFSYLATLSYQKLRGCNSDSSGEQTQIYNIILLTHSSLTIKLFTLV